MDRASHTLNALDRQKQNTIFPGPAMAAAKKDPACDDRILSIHSLIVDALPDLGAHCRRVARLALRSAMYLRTDGAQEICYAALVHDVGKLFIDPAILEKRSALSSGERIQVDLHSVLGYVYLRARDVSDSTAQMVLLHHGYKKETCGHADGIRPNFGADLIRACDIYDAMTNDRPYHKAVSPGEAMEILSTQPEPLSEEIIRAVRMSI